MTCRKLTLVTSIGSCRPSFSTTCTAKTRLWGCWRPPMVRVCSTTSGVTRLDRGVETAVLCRWNRLARNMRGETARGLLLLYGLSSPASQSLLGMSGARFQEERAAFPLSLLRLLRPADCSNIRCRLLTKVADMLAPKGPSSSSCRRRSASRTDRHCRTVLRKERGEGGRGGSSAEKAPMVRMGTARIWSVPKRALALLMANCSCRLRSTSSMVAFTASSSSRSGFPTTSRGFVGRAFRWTIFFSRISSAAASRRRRASSAAAAFAASSASFRKRSSSSRRAYDRRRASSSSRWRAAAASSRRRVTLLRACSSISHSVARPRPSLASTLSNFPSQFTSGSFFTSFFFRRFLGFSGSGSASDSSDSASGSDSCSGSGGGVGGRGVGGWGGGVSGLGLMCSGCLLSRSCMRAYSFCLRSVKARASASSRTHRFSISLSCRFSSFFRKSSLTACLSRFRLYFENRWRVAFGSHSPSELDSSL
mmetsp:Transcript_16414/g.29133  ORF Transcript_16414/g.29133 Transcript_16414/m.29133 type:complete len:479 (-) Transcript_16414:2526-3962(-)